MNTRRLVLDIYLSDKLRPATCEEVTLSYFRQMFETYQGNVSRTASSVGISRATAYRYAKKCGADLSRIRGFSSK